MLKQNNSNAISPQNINITIGNAEYNLLLNSGNGSAKIILSLAKHIMYKCIQAKLLRKKPLKLESFSNDTVETLGTLKTTVKLNDWQIPRAKIIVVVDGFRPML